MDLFIRENEYKEITGLSRTTRWREERAGRFPPRRKIGQRAKAYVESEILAWIEKHMGKNGLTLHPTT